MREVNHVTLEAVEAAELLAFAEKLQETIAAAAAKECWPWEREQLPSAEELRKSLEAPGAAVYHVLLNGRRAGGLVVRIDEKTQHNSVDLFFISREYHSRGVGLAAWKAVESAYPETRVWELMTPCFELRNIHFCVNKCGFHIKEICNEYNRELYTDCLGSQTELLFPGSEDFFRFEKIMKQ